MRAATERVEANRPNAWGQMSPHYRQRFEVEPGDVGKARPHYLGFNHRVYIFTPEDAGRTIEVLTYAHENTTSWHFYTEGA